MSKRQHSRRGGRPRLDPRRHTQIGLHGGADLAGYPPLPRLVACPTGKLGHPNRDIAEALLAGIDRRDPRRREKRAYRCEFCRCWHLTSKDLRSDDALPAVQANTVRRTE